MKSVNNLIAAVAVVIYPASVLGVDKLSGLIFIIVGLLGLGQMVLRFSSVFPITKEERYFFFSVSFLMVTAIVATIINQSDFARADRFLILVFIIPSYIFFKYTLLEEKYIWYGLTAGAFIACFIATYQVFGPAQLERATGVVHEIIFGDLALIMGVMSLAGLGWFKSQKRWMIIFPVLSFIVGVVASALSLSRGAWIALPFFALLLMWYSSKRLSLKLNLITLSLVIIMMASLYLFPQTGVRNRIEISVDNIDRYFTSYDTGETAELGSNYIGSIGARLEMWKGAWIIFLDHPVIGCGWGNYTEKAQELVDKGVINKIAAKSYHPHNQFISALAKGGGLGVISIFILYFYSIYVFYKLLRNSNSPKNQRLALAGLVLLIGFLSFGLTEAVLERSKPITFFSFYLAVVMALALKRDNKE